MFNIFNKPAPALFCSSGAGLFGKIRASDPKREPELNSAPALLCSVLSPLGYFFDFLVVFFFRVFRGGRSRMAAWAAARRAIGTRYGEQLT